MVEISGGKGGGAWLRTTKFEAEEEEEEVDEGRDLLLV